MVNHALLRSLREEETMVADRRVREIARGQDPIAERQRLGTAHAPDDGSPQAGAGAPSPFLLPQLMHEAARALHAAEARAAELEEQITRAASVEQQMEAAVRSEQARADAAESRAQAAEDRLAVIEKRALAAIRVLERRAEVAEARVQAAESWIERVHSAASSRPDELAASKPPHGSKLEALIASGA